MESGRTLGCSFRHRASSSRTHGANGRSMAKNVFQGNQKSAGLEALYAASNHQQSESGQHRNWWRTANKYRKDGGRWGEKNYFLDCSLIFHLRLLFAQTLIFYINLLITVHIEATTAVKSSNLWRWPFGENSNNARICQLPECSKTDNKSDIIKFFRL